MSILSILEVNRKETARKLKNEMGVEAGLPTDCNNRNLAKVCLKFYAYSI